MTTEVDTYKTEAAGGFGAAATPFENRPLKNTLDHNSSLCRCCQRHAPELGDGKTPYRGPNSTYNQPGGVGGVGWTVR